MYTISLHNVRLFIPLGLYPQEALLENEFETDVDIWSPVSDPGSGHFVDYTLVNTIIREAFIPERCTLELLCEHIYQGIYTQFPFVKKIRVCVRKLHPPMEGQVSYAQVVLEK